ncbi:MAG: hypothetical protein M3Q44_05575 [bacterium]|nr:hypothetical protein [bacterium]
MNELLDFIIQARAVGETNDQIVASLIAIGWTSDQIAAGLLEADKQIAPIFAIPVQPMNETVTTQYIPDPPVDYYTDTPVLPEIPESEMTPLTSAVPMYVNVDAIKGSVPGQSHKKAITIVSCIAILFIGIGYSHWKGLLNNPFRSLPKTQIAKSVFADFELIKKDTALMLNDSVRFTLTGFQLMGKDEFNALQDGGGSTIADGNQALLVYYNLQNLSEDARVIVLTESSTIPFSIVDKAKSRIDIDSAVLTESVANLAELKPKQYTSNALIFEIPQSVTNIHDLYFLLQASDAQPPKGYIQL